MYICLDSCDIAEVTYQFQRCLFVCCLVDSLGIFCIDNHGICRYRDHFISFSPIFVHFISFAWLSPQVAFPELCQLKVQEWTFLPFSQTSRENNQSLPIMYNVSCRFFMDALYKVEIFLYYYFPENFFFFYHEQVLNFIKCLNFFIFSLVKERARQILSVPMFLVFKL